MNHSNLKGKTFPCTIKTVYEPKYLEDLVSKLAARLQPGYYGLTNEFDSSIELDGKSYELTLKTDSFKFFAFSMEDVNAFLKNYVTSCEGLKISKDEKVNRFQIKARQTTLRLSGAIPQGGKIDGEGLITFRAGGDYTVKREGKESLSYGPKLKAENFTETGFKVKAFDGGEIVYTINA